MNAEFSVIYEKESKPRSEFRFFFAGTFGNQLFRVSKYDLFEAGFENSKLLLKFTGDGTLSVWTTELTSKI